MTADVRGELAAVLDDFLPRSADLTRITDLVDRIAGKRAAEKLRAMAAELSDSDQYVEIALGGAAYVQTWLRDHAAALDAEEEQ